MSLALLRYWREGLLGLAAIVIVVAYRSKLAAERAEGIAMERSRVADSTLKAITPQLARAESVYVRDTIRLTRTLTQTSVQRDTLLLHLTDTVRVKEFIAQTKVDSAACFEAARSCAADKRLLNDKINALQVKLAAQPATLDTKHWYSDRVSLGPYAGIDMHGKGSIGVSAQLSVFRFP